jgi:response regulator of citrate/malate metabolism
VGRLHQTLLQFVEMQETMWAIVRVPQTSITAIESFVAAKLAASMDAGMQTALLNLVRHILRALYTHKCNHY